MTDRFSLYAFSCLHSEKMSALLAARSANDLAWFLFLLLCAVLLTILSARSFLFPARTKSVHIVRVCAHALHVRSNRLLYLRLVLLRTFVGVFVDVKCVHVHSFIISYCDRVRVRVRFLVCVTCSRAQASSHLLSSLRDSCTVRALTRERVHVCARLCT